MSQNHITGLPGVQSTTSTQPLRSVVADAELLPGGAVIDGARSTDSGNTPDTDVIRAATLMYKDDTSGKYFPAIPGLSTADYTSGETELTTSTDTALNLLDAVGGAAGLPANVGIVGVPVAGNPASAVKVRTVAVSAIDTGTGVLTITDLAQDFASGAVLLQGTFVNDAVHHSNKYAILDYPNTGIQVSNRDRNARIDVSFAEPVIGGYVRSELLNGVPSEAGTKQVLEQIISFASRIAFIG